MASTTTYASIRDNYTALLEAATPAVLPGMRFRRSPRHQRLRDFALASGTACLRTFEITREALAAEPFVQDPAVIERQENCVLTVAYPVAPGLYGRLDLDDMETVMRRDARQIRDLVFSSGSYLAGQSAGFPSIDPPDRSDGRVWFGVVRLLLIYTEAQALT